MHEARTDPAAAANRRLTIAASPVRVGVSACLCGQRVRYDGSDKNDALITAWLARYVELLPLCPEVAIGMGVPRPPIQLIGNIQHPRAVGVEDSALDVTATLRTYGKRMTCELVGISGYIFKSRSPSCGLRDVEVYGKGTKTKHNGTGLFAREWITRRPLLPVEDEIRFSDARARDSFIERVFVYHRWQQLMATGLSRRKLLGFHAAHALTLMAHTGVREQRLPAMGRGVPLKPSAEFARRYLGDLMRVLRRGVTRQQHARVLRYALRRLRPGLTPGDRTELSEAIRSYKAGKVPLVAPVTLLNHHLQHSPQPDLEQQIYLTPSTAELMLRYCV